jgi:hypothetical protein
MFNIVQYPPATPKFSNSAFGQINNRAKHALIQFTLRFAF